MTRRPRRGFYASVALCLPLAVLAPIRATAGDVPQFEDYGEIAEHLIGPHPEVWTPWQDLTQEVESGSWQFELTVDELGAVTAARLTSGPAEFREDAVRAARAVRFKPFMRNGRPATVRIAFSIWQRLKDYSGPAERTFPANPDLSTAVIALQRTACLGTCPAYRVELHGDGEVQFRGEQDVLVRGRHHWRVDPGTIAPLLDLFRRANYFALDGYYEAPVTDLPTYITRLSIGDQHKFVLDYGAGGDMGGAVASTSTGGEVPNMPPEVTQIESAIDRISGATGYIEGDENTLQRLRAEHWHFRSRDAGHGLRMLLSDCKTGLAREFIEAGAPVNIVGDGYGSGLPISFAARCADVDLVSLMISKGALARRSDANSFLWASVGSGIPAMVTLALKHYGNVNVKNQEGASLLAHAAGTFAEDDYPNAAAFDQVKVIEMLIAGGADPNARDADGRTPIFEANEAAVTAALIKGGAKPDARDNDGQTPLFDHYFDETKPVLLAAGADVNARDKYGRTALFYQDGVKSIKALLDGGVDIEAADSRGLTAIEILQSAEAFQSLRAAGAKLPADPARLRAMIDQATEHHWLQVVAQLKAAQPSE